MWITTLAVAAQVVALILVFIFFLVPSWNFHASRLFILLLKLRNQRLWRRFQSQKIHKQSSTCISFNLICRLYTDHFDLFNAYFTPIRKGDTLVKVINPIPTATQPFRERVNMIICMSMRWIRRNSNFLSWLWIWFFIKRDLQWRGYEWFLPTGALSYCILISLISQTASGGLASHRPWNMNLSIQSETEAEACELLAYWLVKLMVPVMGL